MSTGTPPPPMPEGFAPVPSTPIAEPAPPALSQSQRIINTYFAPTKTFEDIRRNPSWWVPWLLLVLVSLGTSVLMVNKVDFRQMARQQIENSPRSAQFESLPKEQQERQLTLITKISKVAAIISPLFSLPGGLILGALLMITFNFVFGTTIGFKPALAIVFYSWLPLLIHALLSIGTLLLRSDTEGINVRNMVATNPAYFMDPNSGSKFVYGMAASLDVFTIWVVILLGIGFAVNSGSRKKVSTGAGIATVAVWFILYRLAFSALGWV